MGSILVILSSLGFATLGIFGKVAFAEGFSRNSALFFRFALALPFMLLLAGLRGGPRPPAKTLFVSFALGAVGIGIEASLFFYTLEKLGAALTGIFLYLYPAFVVILSHFLGDRMNLRKALLVTLALLGSVLTSGATEGLPTLEWRGLLGGVLTGAWYAVYILTGNRVTRDQDPLWVSTGVVAGSLGVFAILASFDSGGWAGAQELIAAGPARARAWLAIGGLALMATVVPFASLYAGMKQIGAVRASFLSTLELVFTVILALVFFDEKLTGLQGFGAALILISVYLTTRHGRE